MKNEDILKAMTDIDDQYIDEAEEAGNITTERKSAPSDIDAKHNRRHLRRFRSRGWKVGLAVACFVGVFVVGYVAESVRDSGGLTSNFMAKSSDSGAYVGAGDYSADSGATEESAAADTYATEESADYAASGSSNYDTWGVGGSESAEAKVAEPAENEQAYGEAGAGDSGTTSVDSANVDGAIQTDKLVYTCNLTIQTKDYKASKQAIREKIDSIGGIVENESESDDNYNWYMDGANDDAGNKYWNLTIRIPTEQYETFINSFGDVGRVTSKTSSVDNISKNYHSTENRIQSLEKQLQKLQEMMNQASSINDMITIESRISEVETELNNEKTWLSDMDTDVAYSTVYLNLEEVKAYSINGSSNLSAGQKIIEAFKGSWHFFVTGIETFAYGLIYVLPFAVVIAVIIGIVKYARKHISKDKKTNQ